MAETPAYRRLPFVAKAVAEYTTMDVKEFEALTACDQYRAAQSAYAIVARELLALFMNPGALIAFVGTSDDEEEERRWAIVAHARDNELQLRHFMAAHESAACKCGALTKPAYAMNYSSENHVYLYPQSNLQ